MSDLTVPFEAAGAATYDVVVIGAGIGGLTAAALLADAGANVLVVERQAVLGGFCHSWYRKVRVSDEVHKFRFDAGAMDFSGAHPGGTIRSVLDRVKVGDQITWIPLEHTYRIGKLSIDVPPDWRDYMDVLCGQFPDQASGIKGFFEAMRLVAAARHSLAPVNGGIPRQPRTVEEREWFAKEHPFALQWKDKPINELLACYVSRPVVASILLRLSHYLTESRENLSVARAADLFRFYFVGGFYPQGGTGRLADALASAIKSRGGCIRVRTTVNAIRLSDGKVCGVTLDDGTLVSTQSVISNSDFKRTFSELLPQEVLPANVNDAVQAMKTTPSGFTVYLAMDYVPTNFKSYTVDANYAFHIPSLIDPTAAPPGYSVFEVRTIFGDTKNWFPPGSTEDESSWRKSAAYALRKRRFGDWLLGQASQIVPELRQHILYRTDASPMTYARYGHSLGGALYGWSGRPTTMEEGRTPVPGLYIAGSSALGAGVETVMISGANAAEAIVPGMLSRGRRFGQPHGASTKPLEETTEYQ